MRRPAFHVLTLLGTITVLTVARTASAQVNVERLRRDLLERPSFAILEGGVSGRTGNVQSLSTSGGLFAGHRHGRHLLFGKAQGEYGRFGGTITVSRSFAHLRYNYELRPRIWGEVFGQAQNDKFERLQLRELYGAGPRFAIVDEPKAELFFGTAYMFEHEELSEKKGSPERDSSTYHRWNNYVSVNVLAASSTRLTTAVYVQPRFDELDDYRLLQESTLAVDITKKVTLRLVVILRRDNAPPTGVRKNDLEIKNTMSITF